MIDLKTSAQAALEFFNSVSPHHGDPVLVEEVELSEDGRYWLITLGYNLPNEPPDVWGLLDAGGKQHREYKTFKIDRETGEVRSMKIRKV